VAQNIERSVQYLQRAGGKADVEGGNVPAGVAAATAIAQLLEQSAEHRKPRIRRIRALLKKLWSHGLKLIAAQWIEPREYRFKSEAGEEKWASLHGLDLQGQTDIDLEPEPISDSPDIRRENVRDLITLQVIKPGMDRNIDRQIIKALDGPTEFYQDDLLQETAAKREWEEFEERDVVPVVDPTFDEPNAHIQEHGRVMETEAFRELASRSDWHGAFRILAADWEQFNRFLMAMPFNAQGAMSPPGSTPPGQLPLPMKDTQTKLVEGWSQRLAQVGFKSPDQEALVKVMTWRAHYEAHRLELEKKQMAAQVAARPQVATPGGESAEGATAPVAA
jgi:hypothetical protein